MIDRVNPSNILPYITRIGYMRLNSFFKEENKPYLDYNRILWERDIFFKNKNRLKKIKQHHNFSVYELDYYGYRLFFIIDIKPWNKRIRVFFVNILKSNTYYELHKNESIMKYKDLTRNPLNPQIHVGDKVYHAIHVGNAFNKYKQLKVSQSKITESVFWDDVRKFYDGEQTNLRFKASYLGEFMIVHSVFES